MMFGDLFDLDDDFDLWKSLIAARYSRGHDVFTERYGRTGQKSSTWPNSPSLINTNTKV